MTASQRLHALLCTVWYRIFARLSGLLDQVLEESFAAGAMLYVIGRSRAMRVLFVLGVTSLLTAMLAAIEESATLVITFKQASPLLNRPVRRLSLAWASVVSFTAKDRASVLSTIAASIQADFASTT